MRLPLYQIDAFVAEAPFTGNPAAVCPLDAWLPEALMQAIAAENNLSETAFFVAERDGYRLRWFTPTTEVDLCGHATLAAGYVVFRWLRPGASRLAPARPAVAFPSDCTNWRRLMRFMGSPSRGTEAAAPRLQARARSVELG